MRVHPGDRIDGRYLVYEQVDENWGVCGWRAHDEVLGRDVLLTTFHPEDPRGPALVEAARAAAGVPDHRFIRILDAQIATPTGFLVREWVGGRTLADAVGGGPLPEAAAAAVARDVAEAVAAAHAAGIAHLCIDPSTVVLADDGAVRIRGLGTAAVLRGVRPGPDGPARDDTVGVGRVLYAGLTARSTEEGASDPASGLPLARRTDASPPAPRQVRAGVSPMLDAITVRALGSGRSHRYPPYQSPREVARALARVSGENGSALPVAAVVGGITEPEHAHAGPPPPHSARPALDPLPDGMPPPAPLPLDVAPLPAQSPPARSPRWLRRLGVVAAVALGAGAVLLGMELIAANRVPELEGGSSGGGGREAATAGSPQATDTAPDASLQVVSVRDFDPLGNGSENADQASAAVDGSTATVWRTQTYYDPLEQQKAGVGLLLDLGRQAPVTSVDLVLDGQPSDVQVRVAPEAEATPPATQDGFAMLGSAQTVEGEVTISGEQQATRYVLVWFTRLPPVPDGWRGGVAEVTVRS